MGAAVARRLADAGYRVAVNSARSVEAGEKPAAELPGVHYVRADVSDQAQATRLVEQTVAHFGRLDLLVNSAGTTRFIPHDDFEAASPEVWRHLYDVNVPVVPLRRVGRPEDIAEAVHDLAKVTYITGEVLLVDGGGHLLG